MNTMFKLHVDSLVIVFAWSLGTSTSFFYFYYDNNDDESKSKLEGQEKDT